MKTPSREEKLASYQLVATIFTEVGDVRIVKAACNLGLSLNPICGVLKFFKGLSYHKKGIYNKSTRHFTEIICRKGIIYDDKLKKLFEHYNIPFDEIFMESLNEAYTKARNNKIATILLLLVGIIVTIIVITQLKL